MIRIEKVKSRIYVLDSPFSTKDELKKLGAHWDADRRAWWIGAAKAAAVEALVARLQRDPAVLLADACARYGLRESTPPAIVADRIQEDESLDGREEAAAIVRGYVVPKEDPDTVRLVGKAKYKGRVYYVRVVTGDRKRCRLVSLDQEVDFWAPLAVASADGVPIAAAEWIRGYRPREIRRNGRLVETVHTTLGSIKAFMERADRDRQATLAGTAEMRTCWECGREVTEFQCRSNGGDWNDSYCGC